MHKVVKTLEERGYALRDENYRLKVNRPGSLLDEWATRYDFVRIKVLFGILIDLESLNDFRSDFWRFPLQYLSELL